MKRVIALMSGGVDSSVAATLLKQQGYDVIGVYILGWTGTKEFPCSWQKEEADAAEVAKKINIPFYTINVAKEYEREVIDQFFASYRAGLTPNPDILCNQEIKFKAVWHSVRQFEPDFIATGHYARLEREFQISNSKFLMNDSMNQVPNIENSGIEDSLKINNSKLKIHSHPAVFKARDENKDQSYFLWGIDRAMLPHILFPLGERKKPEVRAMAKKYKLPTATKKDSQGICFIGPLKVREFLKSQISSKPGPAVLKNGQVIAEHEGIQFYTIGQRLGASELKWQGDPPPLFVLAKDISTNTLIVGSDAETFSSKLIAHRANWLTTTPQSFECLAKIRYRQEDVRANVSKINDSLRISFAEPVRAITPGQSIVFYDDNGQLLGGALITNVSDQDAIVRQVAKQATRIVT